jgi:hypothetical protein
MAMMTLRRPHQRRRVCVLFLMLLCSACVKDREDACSRQSDCKEAFCSGPGFCSHECVRDSDCPCASYCEKKCGICIREDNHDPATCYPIVQGLTVEEIKGVCASNSPPPDDTDRSCTLAPVTVDSCLAGRPADGGAQ